MIKLFQVTDPFPRIKLNKVKFTNAPNKKLLNHVNFQKNMTHNEKSVNWNQPQNDTDDRTREY